MIRDRIPLNIFQYEVCDILLLVDAINILPCVLLGAGK